MSTYKYCTRCNKETKQCEDPAHTSYREYTKEYINIKGTYTTKEDVNKCIICNGGTGYTDDTCYKCYDDQCD